ncbi:hypothetical protein [Lihuaxuella thermophila]|uniref:Uncharacterized protein n=1 Tax=Lihuaxuella thermophila TaxID=1173111 RepID=A0A1H8D8D8_9BACL|nr:hypothetical protein [Lihuaxuella thermophila]SEN03611.1 hypothetical protein SAMN05444955_10552 [Lihuaxuella thermophila]
MEERRLNNLRRKQFIYMNLMFAVTLILLLGLVLSRASGVVVYSVLGLIFLIPAISLQISKRPHPFLQLFPGMKELIRYELDKLGNSWRRYYTSGFLLQFALSIFFFIQALIRDGNTPFMEGIPFWYLIVIPLVMLLVLNFNLRVHTRRIDQKTPEQLKVYADDKMLFSLVFASVSVVMTLLGTLVVMVMT